MTGGLGPILTGQTGTLNATGEAIAKLDLSFLPPIANGIRVWIGAVLRNPAAPLGISLIPDTKAFVIEGL